MATSETYTPTRPPANIPVEVQRYLNEELQRIAQKLAEFEARLDQLENP